MTLAIDSNPERKVADTSGQDVILDPVPRARRRQGRMLIASCGIAVLVVAMGWMIRDWLHPTFSVPRTRVRIATVTRGQFIRDVAAEGTVVVANSPTLFAVASGIVTFAVNAGDEVTEGKLLASVDSPALRNELAREQATLDGLTVGLQRQANEMRRQLLESQEAVDLANRQIRASERELERMKNGFNQGVVPRRDLDKAQDARDDAQIISEHALTNTQLQQANLEFDLKAKRDDLERQKFLVYDLRRRVDALAIRSPVKGVVGGLLVNQKAAVVENEGLLTVIDLSALEVEFTVPETYASDLAINMKANINYSARNYPTVVASISPEIQRNEVRGRLRFAERVPPGVRQNQRVNVRIVLEDRGNVLKVERGAFVDGGSVAYRVIGDIATRQSVTLGAMSVGEVEILSGLNAGDRIIVSSISEFGDAQQVRLTN